MAFFPRLAVVLVRDAPPILLRDNNASTYYYYNICVWRARKLVHRNNGVIERALRVTSACVLVHTIMSYTNIVYYNTSTTLVCFARPTSAAWSRGVRCATHLHVSSHRDRKSYTFHRDSATPIKNIIYSLRTSRHTLYDIVYGRKLIIVKLLCYTSGRVVWYSTASAGIFAMSLNGIDLCSDSCYAWFIIIIRHERKAERSCL